MVALRLKFVNIYTLFSSILILIIIIMNNGNRFLDLVIHQYEACNSIV